MDPISIVVNILNTAISVAATWWFSRYYYLKAKPEKASVQALIAAVHRESKAKGKAARESPTEVPLKLGMALIEAFEKGEIFVPELVIAAKAINDTGALILDKIRFASQAAALAGMTLTPPWQQAYSKAVREGLAEVKSGLISKLSKRQ